MEIETIIIGAPTVTLVILIVGILYRGMRKILNIRYRGNNEWECDID